jgi:ABC-2 type transport system permease protein
VTVSRAVTSAFASMLRSRRVRDLAAVLLALLAALLGPLQIAGLNVLTRADWDSLLDVARVLAWTPLAAPYTVGIDLAEGRAGAALLKLLVTAVVLGLLLWWWSRSLESAMVGATGSGPAASRRGAGGPVDQLFPRALLWVPRNRYGALVARQARYWWRETRQRAALITFAVVGVFVPAVTTLGVHVGDGEQAAVTASLTMTCLSMLFVGTLAAVSLANQFGYDGSAYAANVIAGVPGKVELRARAVAISAYMVPLLAAIAVAVGLFLGEPAWIPAMVGTLFAAYGSGLAVNLYASIFGAYALPETSNPFAVNTGAGTAKSLIGFVALIAGGAAATPVLVATVLLGDAWLWLALPVGLGYGFGAATLGTYLAGDVLDHRMPELLAAVTPRR